jgi:sodium/hydrogen antiporter
MDVYIINLIVVGFLLLLVTLGSGWIKRLPFSYALIYLCVGIGLGPYGFNLIQIRPGAEFLERLSEFVVLISLFSCGLKMNRLFKLRTWRSTLQLIGLVMPISIFAIAAVGHWLLGLNWGAAILLGAILAPTDPVLASEVQLEDPRDHDELRFGLTSEGGLNDALAFPFVYFGLRGLDGGGWGSWFQEWVLVDVIWAISAGYAVGVAVPKIIVRIDKQLQQLRPADSLMEDFVALSIVLITYAVAEIINGYGFLAVFMAGIVTHRNYHNPEKRLSQLEFIERIEKLVEVGTILLLGALLLLEPMQKYWIPALVVVSLLLFVIRPLGVWISTPGQPTPIRLLWGWFGIRGVGSIYYLSYALGEGLKDELGEQIAWITFMTIVASVVLHGVTATPLMNWYDRRAKRAEASP